MPIDLIDNHFDSTIYIVSTIAPLPDWSLLMS
jgi:hypothetical protein